MTDLPDNEKHKGACEGCDLSSNRLIMRQVKLQDGLSESRLYCLLCAPDLHGTPTTTYRLDAVRALRASHEKAVAANTRWEQQFKALAVGRSDEEVEAALLVAPSDAKVELSGFLSPNSLNFMGTGLSFGDWFAQLELGRIGRAFHTQSREEKKRRLRLVMVMSHALVNIRRQDRFGTALGEAAIEAVLDGSDLKGWTDHFTCEEDIKGTQNEAMVQHWREVAKRWSGFTRLLRSGWQYLQPIEAEIAFDDPEAMVIAGGWVQVVGGYALRDEDTIDGRLLAEFFAVGVRWFPGTETDAECWINIHGGFPFEDPRPEMTHRFYDTTSLLNWSCRRKKSRDTTGESDDQSTR